MSSTVPYIGSKISLVSNSDIRYEGILYTINTQESTIALQSVRCCGTEGRKIPEIPPSSEIYDFIIFRGQDIKDLTVLESANPALSAQLNDPAIMSVNQRPAGAAAASKSSSGGKGAAADKGGKDSGGYGGGKGSSSGAGYGGGKGSTNQSNSGGNWSGGWSGGWSKPDGRSNDRSYRSGGYGGWDSGASYGKGSGGKGKAAEAPKGGKAAGKGKDKGSGKAEGKGGKATDKGKAKDGKGDKGGKSFGKGGKATEGKSSSKGGKASEAGAGGRRGGGGGGGAGGDSSGGAPVGELLPSSNEAEKTKYAEDFDYESENKKFEGAKKGVEGEEVDDKLKPLSGYDSKSSFFDNISCEATERAGDAERPKVDRNKARQNDRETFGDTRRPPRPTGGRRGKGGRRGAPRGYRN